MSSPGRSASQCQVSPSPARSASQDSTSDMSLVSTTSRLSQLSRKTFSKYYPSTEEIEQRRIEAKRREVKALMARNEQTFREAINCPEVHCGHRSLEITVPEEFNFGSCVRRVRSCCSDAGSDCDRSDDWSCSLRRPSAPPSQCHAWQPQLTVPEAPILHTAHRSRSTSSRRSGSGTPRRAMSRHRLPREQAAIERHLERTGGMSRASEDCPRHLRHGQPELSRGALAVSAEEEEELRGGGGLLTTTREAAGTTAQERAERARALAQAKRDEALACEKKRLFQFKASTTTSTSSTGDAGGGPPAAAAQNGGGASS